MLHASFTENYFFNEISSKGVQGHTVLQKKLILHKLYATK